MMDVSSAVTLQVRHHDKVLEPYTRTGRLAKARPPGVIIGPLRTRMSGSCCGTGSAA